MVNLSPRDIKPDGWKPWHDAGEIIDNLPEWDISPKAGGFFEPGKPWGDSANRLIEFYRQWGSGSFARYKGFIWERSGDQGILRGVDDPDPVRLSDFIGYEQQRNEIIDNTLRFLKGYPANNLLLYGDRGTGKSSTVKALLNEYHALGLRIIEVSKELMPDFNQILRIIRNRPQKFIIFIDDLSFSDDESTYTALKAVLEGSLESKPGNIPDTRPPTGDTWSGEVQRQGRTYVRSLMMKSTRRYHGRNLSLADRFGMTITFTAPTRRIPGNSGGWLKRGIRIEKMFQKKAYNGKCCITGVRQGQLCTINWLEDTKK